MRVMSGPGDFLPRRTKAYGLVRRHTGLTPPWDFLPKRLGIPALIAFLVIIGESFRRIGLDHRFSDPAERRGCRHDHAGRYCDGPLEQRNSHELVGQAGR